MLVCLDVTDPRHTKRISRQANARTFARDPVVEQVTTQEVPDHAQYMGFRVWTPHNKHSVQVHRDAAAGDFAPIFLTHLCFSGVVRCFFGFFIDFGGRLGGVRWDGMGWDGMGWDGIGEVDLQLKLKLKFMSTEGTTVQGFRCTRCTWLVDRGLVCLDVRACRARDSISRRANGAPCSWRD